MRLDCFLLKHDIYTHAMFKCAIRIQIEFVNHVSRAVLGEDRLSILVPSASRHWSFGYPILKFLCTIYWASDFNPSPDQNEFVWGPNKRTKLNMQYSCINRKKVVLFFNYNHNPFRLVQHTIEKSWNIILGYINWGTLNDTNTACGMTGSTTFGMGFQPTSPEKLPSMTLTIRAYWRLIYQQQPRSWGLNIAIETSWTGLFQCPNSPDTVPVHSDPSHLAPAHQKSRQQRTVWPVDGPLLQHIVQTLWGTWCSSCGLWAAFGAWCCDTLWVF